MSYYPDDPDGYDLYLIHVPGQDQPDQVYKMNIETGDTAWVWGLTAPEAATGTGGCWITNGWDVYSWVMMTVANVSPGGGGDRIEVYQLERRMDWFNLDLNSGRIEAGERQTLTLTLCADGLPEALFESEIAFYSNAGDGRNSLHISMDVTGEDQILMPFDLLSPEDGDTIRVDFGPINENDSLQIVPTEFVWGASLNLFDPEIPVEYRLTLTAGMGVWDTTISDTSIEIDLFQTGLPFVEGAPVIWFVTASSLGHDLESMHRFTFRLLSNSDGGAVGVPAQFGIAGVYPNPFNAATTISFGLTERSRAKLTAYDALGREVAEIFDGSAAAGYHRIGWNAGGLPAGVYILRLEAGGRKSLSKVAILK